VDDRRTVATPALTPAVLAGLALRPLPEAALRPLVGLALDAMRRRHPGVFSRLADLGEDAVVIDPEELPFAFVLRPGASPPALVPVRKPVAGDDPAPRAVIRGPLAMLIDLAEGRIDGDAVFFSRALSVEGDASAVVTLRNALESAEIDVLGDVLSALGPMAPAARGAAGIGLALLRRAADDLDALRVALLGPVTRRCDDRAAALRVPADRVTALPAPPAQGSGRAIR
jgi:predicted lipid carrier protein YhbT